MRGFDVRWPGPAFGWNGSPNNEAAIAVALAHNAFQIAVTYTSSSGKAIQIFWSHPEAPPAFATTTHVVLSGEFVVELYRSTGYSQRKTWVILLCIVSHELGHIEFKDGVNFDHPWVRELRADHFSGGVARLAGVGLQEVWEYATFLQRVQGFGSFTHPPGGHRLNAVLHGYHCN